MRAFESFPVPIPRKSINIPRLIIADIFDVAFKLLKHPIRLRVSLPSPLFLSIKKELRSICSQRSCLESEWCTHNLSIRPILILSSLCSDRSSFFSSSFSSRFPTAIASLCRVSTRRRFFHFSLSFSYFSFNFWRKRTYDSERNVTVARDRSM